MRNFMLKAAAWAQTRHQPHETGQTVIEYALVTAVVSIALIILMANFGVGIIGDAKDKLDNYIT
ncbi:MAG: Flp family type IVb pilin [Dehalococcoidia bacterium]